MSKYIKLENAINDDCILIDEIECDFCPFNDEKRALCRIVEWLKSLPTIEVSEDCISRADLPKMLNGVVLDDCDQIVDEFLEEHECDELWNTVRALRDFYEWTIDAPSVVPTVRKNRTVEQSSKVGEWIDKGDYAECSNCGAKSGTQYDGVEPVPHKSKFCSNCGAKMKG